MKKSNLKRGILVGIIILCLYAVFAIFIKPGLTTLTYSNLADQNTLNEVIEELRATGVSEDQIEIFNDQLAYTNGYLGDYHTFHDGFVEVRGPSAKYDEYDAFNRFITAKQPFDINCRIAAWPLIQDIVQIDKTWTKEQVQAIGDGDGGILGYEKGAIIYNPYTHLTEEDLTRFWGLYEKIPRTLPTGKRQSVKAIQKAWEERGIMFEESNRSLISAFVYNIEERALQVEHAGVLIQREDDLLFLERWNPGAPYQASIFKDRGELKYYLQCRLRENLMFQAVIMENDELLGK